MKKKTAAIWLSVVLCAAMLAGCGNAKGDDSGTQTGAAAQAGEAIPEEETATAQNEESVNGTGGNVETGEAAGDTAQNGTGQAGTETPDDGTGDSAGDKAETQATDSDKTADGEKTVVRVGSLKGPTSMGLVYLMDQAGKGESANQYEFTMTAAADELLPAMLSGELDIVLIPANMASVLYNRAEGDVSVIDINTLGVLYAVSGNKQIKEMKDLKGRTVYMTGKGTTPDYVMQYLLKENGLTAADVTLEYKSEAAEVAAMLAEMPEAVGVLPQPLVTVVRYALLTEAPASVELFLEEHAASAAYANEHVEETAQLVAAAGIIDKAPVAAKALPECNITYIDGAEMKTALSGYLQVLWEQDPESVGGGLPGDGFYYVK